MDRYSVPENEDFEPDSNSEVLKSFLGIKDKDTMEQVEELELERVGNMLPDIYPNHLKMRNFNFDMLA